METQITHINEKEKDTTAILLKLGNRIKEVRVNRAINQARLAELCNIEKSSISRIESGKSNITMSTLVTIAGALDTNLEELFRGVD